MAETVSRLFRSFGREIRVLGPVFAEFGRFEVFFLFGLLEIALDGQVSHVISLVSRLLLHYSVYRLVCARLGGCRVCGEEPRLA